ncbi:glycosyl hydrolases family 35-domain-containing protein [Entophlyctis helioformis]|nr:glycosyl hydrolases family 35-domain-containing protein [Entophlyctis helioformis]
MADHDRDRAAAVAAAVAAAEAEAKNAEELRRAVQMQLLAAQRPPAGLLVRIWRALTMALAALAIVGVYLATTPYHQTTPAIITRYLHIYIEPFLETRPIYADVTAYAGSRSRSQRAALTAHTDRTLSARAPYNVTFDSRAFLVNGKRQMLVAGSIHYPRSTPTMWPEIFRRTKAAGINVVDTYVFWNLNEPQEGVYDFATGYGNLPLFIRLAQEAGLYVNLRIGPYVCAEWNYGGLPVWLLDKPGIEFRTWNQPFMDAMETFIVKVLQVVEPFLPRNGGPIIMLQIENEYGFVEGAYGSDGDKYIHWAADLAAKHDVGVPWFMCKQDRIVSIITTCNGFYCDNWIAEHRVSHPAHPHMFTELWSGWFQNFGSAKPRRPAEDLAFSLARWAARGGTYAAHYMWHGGTNFARWSGPYITTSYDYDAPMREYGFANTPKYEHLSNLHWILHEFADVMLGMEPVLAYAGGHQEVHVYGDPQSPQPRTVVAFLSNYDEWREAVVEYQGVRYTLPRWSVTIITRDAAAHDPTQLAWVVLYRTSSAPPATQSVLASPESSPLRLALSGYPSQWHSESPGIWNETRAIVAQSPLEQIRTTRDTTDYLWYVRKGLRFGNSTAQSGTTVVSAIQSLIGSGSIHDPSTTVVFEHVEDVMYLWLDDVYIGAFEKPKQDLEQSDVTSIRNLNVDLAPFLLAQQNGTGEINSGVDHTLTVLTCTAGLVNFGSHAEHERKGILGSVTAGGVPITQGEWTHQIGTLGEALRVHEYTDPDRPFWSLQDTIPAWRSAVPKATPLTWYRILIPMRDVYALLEPIRRRNTPGDILAFALYTGTMGRGAVWANGHHLGRYWSAVSPSTGSGCATNTCPYTGPFWGTKCLTHCGQPSQVFLHLPAEWVLGTCVPPWSRTMHSQQHILARGFQWIVSTGLGSKPHNGLVDDGTDAWAWDWDKSGAGGTMREHLEIVVFEERGGDPTGLHLVAMSG